MTNYDTMTWETRSVLIERRSKKFPLLSFALINSLGIACKSCVFNLRMAENVRSAVADVTGIHFFTALNAIHNSMLFIMSQILHVVNIY